jgi:ATP-dependent exoDNAse (exonuclease V) beta subunit
VKVLTIHKAKGLEFPVVIVPFLEMDAGVDKAVTYEVEAGLMRRLLTKKYCRFSERISNLYAEEYERSVLDELDNIYVALTRPIQELYCFIPEKAKKGVNPANYLIPEGAVEMGKKKKPTLERGTKESHPPFEVPLPEYKSWLGVLKDEFIDEEVLLRQESVLRGEVLHTILSFIGDLDRQEAGQVLEEAIRKTKFLYPFFKEWSEVEGIVERLILDERFRPFFFLGEGSVAQEKEVVDGFGRTYRIDRLVIKEDEVWVLDYKSSRQEQKTHHAQVKGYMSLAKAVFESKTIKGFLAYLDELDIEEVHG